MMLPKTYLDRRGRKSNKYVFISYSHRDKGYVFPMLQLLYDAGVDYWYDKELNDGEVWNEEIHEIITSSDCVGTIFFLSENAILSNAVCQEVRASVLRIVEHEFFVLPVFVGLSGYQEMLQKLAASSAYRSIGDFSSLMKNEDRVYICDMDDKADTCGRASVADRIVAFCRRIGVSEENYIELRGTNFSAADEKKLRYYELGMFPRDASGQLAPIRWKLISRQDNLLTFVSEYCLDFVEYGSVFNIAPAQFGLQDSAEVVSLRLLDCKTLEMYRDLIGRTIPTDYADFKRTQSFRAFWIRSNHDTLLLYNSLNRDTGEIADPENETFTAGIRLLLVVDDKMISIGR